MSAKLVFLKLGGSLITIKDCPHTPRPEVLERLASEIGVALSQDSELRVLLGHGSGSFGHVPANRYHTRQGVHSPAEWQGFAEVWREAAGLNDLMMSALAGAKLPAVAFSPSSAVTATDGAIVTWNLKPIQAALANNLLPVIHGDVVFDEVRGGTILSTEDLFTYLVPQLHPARLLFAGIEPGVWRDYPHNTDLVAEITPGSFADIETRLKGSASTDVTGGMLDKVGQLITATRKVKGLRACIFSGKDAGNVRRALLGDELGTVIHA